MNSRNYFQSMTGNAIVKSFCGSSVIETKFISMQPQLHNFLPVPDKTAASSIECSQDRLTGRSNMLSLKSNILCKLFMAEGLIKNQIDLEHRQSTQS